MSTKPKDRIQIYFSDDFDKTEVAEITEAFNKIIPTHGANAQFATDSVDEQYQRNSAPPAADNPDTSRDSDSTHRSGMSDVRPRISPSRDTACGHNLFRLPVPLSRE